MDAQARPRLRARTVAKARSAAAARAGGCKSGRPGRCQGQRAKLAERNVAGFLTIIGAALKARPLGLGRPKAVWATEKSKVEFKGPGSAARKAFRRHGRIQAAMKNANMVHNRHQSTLRHTFG